MSGSSEPSRCRCNSALGRPRTNDLTSISVSCSGRPGWPKLLSRRRRNPEAGQRITLQRVVFVAAVTVGSDQVVVLPPEERTLQIPRPVVFSERLPEEPGRGDGHQRIMRDEDVQAGPASGAGEQVLHQEPGGGSRIGHPRERVVLRHEMLHDALVPSFHPVRPGAIFIDHIHTGVSQQPVPDDRNVRCGPRQRSVAPARTASAVCTRNGPAGLVCRVRRRLPRSVPSSCPRAAPAGVIGSAYPISPGGSRSRTE